jgi:dTDP-4-dehydrorhamnose reductase
MKIFVTGADGALGSEMQNLLRREKISFMPADIKQFDITDFRKTNESVLSYHPDIILHFAAISDVDQCENDPDLAYRVNALSCLGLATIARKINAKILYTSTNYVFDGKKETGYYEGDSAQPISAYGRSKLAGENFIRDLVEHFFIVRTAWLFGKNSKTFITRFLANPEKPPAIDVICDQVGSFTYIPDLAEAIFTLIKSENYGVFHLVNQGSASWLEFTLRAKDHLMFKTEIQPVKTEELNLPAPRPAFGYLLSRHYEFFFEKSMRKWEAALDAFTKELQSQHH